MKTLGLDIDGVLADFLGYCIPQMAREFDVYAWPELRSRNISKHTEQLFAHYANMREIYAWLNPIPWAAAALSCLCRSYKISYITARPLMTKTITIDWLDRHGFPRGKVVNVRDCKVPAIKRMGVDIYVDDRLQYVLPAVGAGIHTYLFDCYERRWLVDDIPNGVTIITNWLELRKHLRDDVGINRILHPPIEEV